MAELVLLSLMLGGTAAALLFNSWEDIEANPVAAIRAAADNIEENPNEIKDLLNVAADEIIELDGGLEAPIGYARFIIEEIITSVLQSWLGPDDLQNPADLPEWYTDDERNIDAVKHHLVFKSFVQHLSQGPTAVAKIVSTLRSAADRVEDAGGTLKQDAPFLDGKDHFYDVIWDTVMVLSPSLNSTWWTDIRTNTLLPNSSTLNLVEREQRNKIIIWNIDRFSKLKICQLGWSQNDSQYKPPGCVYNGTPLKDLQDIL